MKLTGIIRSSEWWEYKLTPLFALGYATALQANVSLTQILPFMLLVVLSIIVGAAYVSVVNDYTDMKEDLACGKHNRLSRLSVVQQRLLLASTILPGLLFLLFLYREPISATFYLLAWVAFSLYSLPPFRFKTRGILGVLADASGAHLFPTLTVVAAVYFFARQQPSAAWMLAVGIWAFAYGLRGILWHQFSDRENDLRAGVSTFAIKWEPHRFKPVAAAILLVEVAAFGVMLYYMQQPLVLLALGLYLAGIAVARTFFGLRIIAILPTIGRQHIFLSTFYQFLLPVVLLAGAAMKQPAVLWLLALHFILFPKNLLYGYENTWRLINHLKTGIASSR